MYFSFFFMNFLMKAGMEIFGKIRPRLGKIHEKKNTEEKVWLDDFNDRITVQRLFESSKLD